jgi:hypothetical protein
MRGSPATSSVRSDRTRTVDLSASVVAVASRSCRNECVKDESRGLRRGEVRAQLIGAVSGNTVDLWRTLTSPTRTSETWRSTPRMSAPSQGL